MQISRACSSAPSGGEFGLSWTATCTRAKPARIEESKRRRQALNIVCDAARVVHKDGATHHRANGKQIDAIAKHSGAHRTARGEVKELCSRETRPIGRQDEFGPAPEVWRRRSCPAKRRSSRTASAGAPDAPWSTRPQAGVCGSPPVPSMVEAHLRQTAGPLFDQASGVGYRMRRISFPVSSRAPPRRTL